MRRVLIVLLGFGVIAGYGSAFASARWHARHHGGCEGRWEERSDRFDRFDRRDESRPAAAPVAPQTVVVPQAAPAPAAAPQVFVIMPGMQAVPSVPQVVTVPVATPAPAPATP